MLRSSCSGGWARSSTEASAAFVHTLAPKCTRAAHCCLGCVVKDVTIDGLVSQTTGECGLGPLDGPEVIVAFRPAKAGEWRFFAGTRTAPGSVLVSLGVAESCPPTPTSCSTDSLITSPKLTIPAGSNGEYPVVYLIADADFPSAPVTGTYRFWACEGL